MRAIYQRRITQIKREMEEHFDLMKENLNSMEGVFDILVPRNEGDSIDFDALMKADYESGTTDTGEKYREVCVGFGWKVKQGAHIGSTRISYHMV